MPRADRPDGFEEDVTFADELVSLFVEEFTQPGEFVFDPFAGFGTTLAVARRMGRRALGVELLPERVAFIRNRLQNVECVIQGDALKLGDLNLPTLDFVITSPPYMNRVNHPQNPLTGYRTSEATGGRSLHQLRHSALTHAAEDGTNTPILLARSRHASVRSLERYARPSPEAVARHVAERDPARRRRADH